MLPVVRRLLLPPATSYRRWQQASHSDASSTLNGEGGALSLRRPKGAAPSRGQRPAFTFTKR